MSHFPNGYKPLDEAFYEVWFSMMESLAPEAANAEVPLKDSNESWGEFNERDQWRAEALSAANEQIVDLFWNELRTGNLQVYAFHTDLDREPFGIGKFAWDERDFFDVPLKSGGMRFDVYGLLEKVGIAPNQMNTNDRWLLVKQREFDDWLGSRNLSHGMLSSRRGRPNIILEATKKQILTRFMKDDGSYSNDVPQTQNGINKSAMRRSINETFQATQNEELRSAINKNSPSISTLNKALDALLNDDSERKRVKDLCLDV